MSEDFLHFIWKLQLFNHSELTLSSGEKFSILKPGIHNHDSGPDFFNGQIKIGQTTWAGNIEIHTKTSNWFKHKHQNDKAYSKIILHVVWENDKALTDENGNQVPTLELKGRVQKSLVDRYDSLVNNKLWIPCEKEIKSISNTTKIQMLDRVLVERLQLKSHRTEQILNLNNHDWEATFYQLLAKYFGFKVNATPFELLATSTPFSIVRKTQNNSLLLTALLFGQAGLLNQNFTDDYPQELKREYQFLKNKFSLESLNVTLWKFMRMRPANFPTIRIAQFASLFNSNLNFFQKIVEEKDLVEIKKQFKAEADLYWKNHFRFDVVSEASSIKRLGDSSIDTLIINVIVPLLFTYSQKTGNEELKERAIGFLEKIKAEQNTIIKRWNSLGLKVTSAYDSQALLQLKTEHCDSKNCLNCTIGNAMLNN